MPTTLEELPSLPRPANRRPDAAWLAAFSEKLATVDAVTFDVFDTALSRRVEAPVDVFALVEKHLVAKFGPRFGRFAEMRELAELDARGRVAQEDVTLDEIYEALPARLAAAAAVLDEIKKTEIYAELSVLFAVPEILEATRRASQAGKKLCFVSDMYMSGAVIGDFLASCGYPGEIDVLVSSETRRTKATGGQWDVLRRRLGGERKILHVGDDHWADYESPRRHGLEAMLFEGYRSDRRRGGALDRHVLPFSLESRKAQLGATGRDDAAFMRAFGESFGCLVVGSFIDWLETRARELEIEQLYFLSRDGHLLHRAWNAAGAGARSGVAASYLNVSRRVLYLADAAEPGPDGRLRAKALDYLTGDWGLALRALLGRAGLLHCKDLVGEIETTLGPLDQPLGAERVEPMRAILRKHSADVLAVFAPLRAATLAYFRQEKLDDRRIGLVDMGWHGNLQAAICDLLRADGVRPAVSGFYYGLWPAATRNRRRTGWMEGAFACDFHPPIENTGLQNAVAILENLHSSSEGTTLGYVHDGARIAPLTQDSPIERNQYETLIAPFQDATIDAIAKVFAGAGEGVTRADLTVEAGLAAIQRMALSPTPDELRILGAIRHSRSFDHAVFDNIVPAPRDDEDLLAALRRLPPWSGEWPVGLYIACKARCRTPQDHELVSTHFAPVVWQLDARTKRAIG